MLPLVGKVTRTGNSVGGNALNSATDALQREGKVTVLTDTFPTETATASAHDPILEKRTGTLSTPRAVPQEKRNSDCAQDNMLQEGTG